jgi:hypothetical protein
MHCHWEFGRNVFKDKGLSKKKLCIVHAVLIIVLNFLLLEINCA